MAISCKSILEPEISVIGSYIVNVLAYMQRDIHSRIIIAWFGMVDGGK